MESLSTQFGTFAVAALVVYFLLRAFGRAKNGELLRSARQHALWCAIIGYFATASSNWFGEAVDVPISDQSNLDVAMSIASAATPGLWVAFIYIASQYTWPRRLKPLRTATLAPRSLTSPIPKKLVTATLVVLILASVTVYSVRDVAAIAPVPETEISADDYSYSNPSQDGLRAAGEILPYLYVSFGILALAATVASIVILRRRPLPGISERNNRLLRTTWLNRLYRTVAVSLAVQAGEALHYKARWFHNESTRYIDGSGAGIEYMDSMYKIGNDLDWTANYAVLGVSVLMLFWRPPTNFENLPRAKRTGFSRLRDQLFSLQYATALLMFVAIFIAWPILPVSDDYKLPTGERETWMLMLFTSAAVFYLALNALYLGYANIVSRQISAAPKHSAKLPMWPYICAGLLIASCLYFLLFPPLDYLWGFVAPSKVVVFALVALLVLAHLGFAWFARRSITPWNVTPAEEIWYRRVLELRSLRAVTSAVAAMLVVGYEFPVRLDLLAIMIFCIPAVIFLERPKGSEAMSLQRTTSA